MLEIGLCLDKKAINAACKQAGRVYSEAFYLYRATDRGEVLASVLFEVLSDCVKTVCYLGGDDPFLFDGLLRAGFHYAEGQGIETGWIPDEFRDAYAILFAPLNYPASQRFNIVNFFSKYKNCSLTPRNGAAAQ